jgi:hypothetical protein
MPKLIKLFFSSCYYINEVNIYTVKNKNKWIQWFNNNSFFTIYKKKLDEKTNKHLFHVKAHKLRKQYCLKNVMYV